MVLGEKSGQHLGRIRGQGFELDAGAVTPLGGHETAVVDASDHPQALVLRLQGQMQADGYEVVPGQFEIALQGKAFEGNIVDPGRGRSSRAQVQSRLHAHGHPRRAAAVRLFGLRGDVAHCDTTCWDTRR